MKKKLLFVCLGNICRSPAAEGIMVKKIQGAGLSDKLLCDSAGTSAYHAGEPADGRMRAAARERGYDLTSRARAFDADNDFQEFDYILTMDEHNYQDVSDADIHGTYSSKVFRMVDFCREHEVPRVPDPYHGGDDGFRLVLDILEDACNGLLDRVRKDTDW